MKSHTKTQKAAEKITGILDSALASLTPEERLKRTQKALKRVKVYAAERTRPTPAPQSCNPSSRLVARSPR